jgi:hypothetical protein
VLIFFGLRDALQDESGLGIPGIKKLNELAVSIHFIEQLGTRIAR